MRNSYEARLLRVVDYIHDHPAGDLSLDALSDVAALSRFHFHRVYRAMTGETAAQAVRRIRMYRASAALVQTGESFAVIAAQVGYPNLASFTRAFGETYGMSPAAFRKRGELRPFTPNRIPEIIMTLPVIIRTEPDRRLGAIGHKGAYHEIGRAFDKLVASMASHGLFAHAGKMIGVYYDDPASTALADLRSHAAFEITDDVPLPSPIETLKLAGGRHAVMTHKGPYAGLPAAYDQLFSVWLPKSGEEPGNAPIFEVYLNSPMDTAPEELLTEICMPLS